MAGSIHDLYMFWAILKYTKDSVVVKAYERDGDGNWGQGIIARVSDVKAAHHKILPVKMRGKTDFDFLSKKEATEAREADIWVMDNRQQLDIPEEKIGRDGKTIWYNKTIIPWIDPDDVVRGTISMSRNVTKVVEYKHRVTRLLKFLSKRINSPLISLIPNIEKLEPQHRALAHTLKEILTRQKKIVSSIESQSK